MNLLNSQFAGLPTRFQHSQFVRNVHLQRHEVLIRKSGSASSHRWGQEVPTLFEESACVQCS